MNRVPLPAGMTLGKSFEYGIDLNLATYGSPDWQAIRRMLAFQPADTETTQDAQTYDDEGSPNSDVTARGFGHSFNVQVNRHLGTGLYLPEVEALLARTKPSAVGELAVIDYRWYHKPAVGAPNPNDAGRGFATVAKTRQNTGPNGEIELLGFTLTGKGSYEEITNPFAGHGAVTPRIDSIPELLPNDGELITIIGVGMLGATAVTIDGDSVEFVVVNGATIIAQMPVGDAGDVPVIVTTPAGSSPAYTLARGA